MRKENLETIFNISINETLGRTILTSGTVMMVVLILFFFGGPVIHDFTTAIIVGLISGTYSPSISPARSFYSGNDISQEKKEEMKRHLGVDRKVLDTRLEIIF